MAKANGVPCSVYTSSSNTKDVLNTVTDLMMKRHSTRVFLPNPVPNELLEEVLSLSQHAPSNSNLQPWRVKIVTGKALDRLSSNLVNTVSSGVPSTVEPIPASYKPYRSALGHQLYGPEGYNIPRTDRERSFKAELRNYTFFDAPVAMIICMDKSLSQVDALSVGIYLQTVCLLLAERGLGTCVVVSVAGYPDVVRKELGIGEDMMVLTGVAVGSEDTSNRVNSISAARDAWTSDVQFLSE